MRRCLKGVLWSPPLRRSLSRGISTSSANKTSSSYAPQTLDSYRHRRTSRPIPSLNAAACGHGQFDRGLGKAQKRLPVGGLIGDRPQLRPHPFRTGLRGARAFCAAIHPGMLLGTEKWPQLDCQRRRDIAGLSGVSCTGGKMEMDSVRAMAPAAASIQRHA